MKKTVWLTVFVNGRGKMTAAKLVRSCGITGAILHIETYRFNC